MPRLLKLAKLHATGNDFLVRVALDPHVDAPLDAPTVAALCDRHRGVGGDGLITLGPSYRASSADCSFRLQNADGGDAEMSGNGMRALAAVAAKQGLGRATDLVVDTPAGVRNVDISRNADGDVVAAQVDMGAPTFEPASIPVEAESSSDLRITVHGVDYCGDAVGMGNPHWVVFVNDVATSRLTQHGRWLEHDDRFPNRTNVEFVNVTARDRMEMRVWERGVGETLSCGTGACAAAAAAYRRGLIDDAVTMAVRGGELEIVIGATIRLGGPVVHIFDVEVMLAKFAGGDGSDSFDSIGGGGSGSL